VIIFAGMMLAVYFGAKRQRSGLGVGSSASSNIMLDSYRPPGGEGNGYPQDFGQQGVHGREFA